jgi:hypothetical protein
MCHRSLSNRVCSELYTQRPFSHKFESQATRFQTLQRNRDNSKSSMKESEFKKYYPNLPKEVLERGKA